MGLPIPEELVGTTQALFYEYRHQSSSTVQPPYTLKEYDWKGSKSMYQIYMAHATEYEAAYALLGSWYHWQRLCKCKWFAKYKAEWDEEKEIRKKAIAEKELIKLAKEGNVTAARTLYGPSGAKKMGRPKNHEDDKEPDFSEELEVMGAKLRRVK